LNGLQQRKIFFGESPGRTGDCEPVNSFRTKVENCLLTRIWSCKVYGAGDLRDCSARRQRSSIRWWGKNRNGGPAKVALTFSKLESKFAVLIPLICVSYRFMGEGEISAKLEINRSIQPSSFCACVPLEGTEFNNVIGALVMSCLLSCLMRQSKGQIQREERSCEQSMFGPVAQWEKVGVTDAEVKFRSGGYIEPANERLGS
jgi:hypothetical protein